MSRERIGIMGGTFNPIHQGHISMAKAALQSARLDRVLMLPDGTPPHKADIAPAEDRWRMVCAAVAQEDGLEPCRMELDREGTTYTIDTLSRLQETYPKASLYYIIGADTLMALHQWHRYEQVLNMCCFLVCPRTGGYTPEELNAERRRLTALGGTFQDVPMELANVSSSDLRAALSRGEPTPMLPVTVREYCGVRGLYGMPQRIPQAERWLEKLFTDLNLKRFSHTLAVAHTARYLARIHHLDMEKAEIAGLLHDCTKCMPLKEMQQMAREHDLTRDEDILATGRLLHAITGAYAAEAQYGIEDPDILRAISRHTTGTAGMTHLDMAVYLADKIEPTRAFYPQLDKVRMMAHLSLEKAMLASMEGTVSHVKKSGKSVHPQTLTTIAWLKTLPECR